MCVHADICPKFVGMCRCRCDYTEKAGGATDGDVGLGCSELPRPLNQAVMGTWPTHVQLGFSKLVYVLLQTLR